MARDFDDVSFEKSGKQETVILGLRDFRAKNVAHLAAAVVNGSTFRITAWVDNKDYELTLKGVSQDLKVIKVERGNGQFKVKVENNGRSLEEIYNEQH